MCLKFIQSFNKTKIQKNSTFLLENWKKNTKNAKNTPKIATRMPTMSFQPLSAQNHLLLSIYDNKKISPKKNFIFIFS